jgi:hypothetical protein
MAGGEFVGFNNSVFLAEKEVADRNYALAYYMKENNCFPKGINVKDCLEFWYQVRKDLLCNHATSISVIRIFLVLLNGSELRDVVGDCGHVGQRRRVPNQPGEGDQARGSSGRPLTPSQLRILRILGTICF